MSDVAKVENFVDGVTKAASSNDVIEVVNPSTGARIAEVTASSDERRRRSRSLGGARFSRME